MGDRVIAIDGPAASGKSTVAELVAEKLSIPYINTGNMYRAVTLGALRAGIDLKTKCDEASFSRLFKNLQLDYKRNAAGCYEIELNGEFPGNAIRSPEVASFVSPVAALPIVRSWLSQKQRDFAALGMIVMEGRDIGTVIFPESRFKFFLTATPEARARRRLAQDGENFDGATLESVAAAIAERDRIDSTRKVAPLKPAVDAEIVDTTEMTIDEVVDYISGRIMHYEDSRDDVSGAVR
ncbi:(d)CMP kinase [Lentisphaerota bacterium ZTH]|nr:(d)CMP kinase [Lentisphaerota bacterium]WET06018.1 (d)CMP kinase [Lentisphaerota bacterium ZTH]